MNTTISNVTKDPEIVLVICCVSFLGMQLGLLIAKFHERISESFLALHELMIANVEVCMIIEAYVAFSSNIILASIFVPGLGVPGMIFFCLALAWACFFSLMPDRVIPFTPFV